MWSADEEKQAAAAAKKKPAPVKGNSIQSINQQNEKSTLGDLEALSALKEKMSGGGGGESKAE
jgi:small subunit ribosomal protein S1